jgi:hypothetical protein
VIGAFGREMMSRQLVELVVDKRHQLGHRVTFAAAELIEELRYPWLA